MVSTSPSGRSELQSSRQGQKRKVDEDADGSPAQSHTRSKRNRYISIACNECKRRKIKCNGQTPCQRCGNLSLECVYAPNCCTNTLKDSEEYQHMKQQLAILQDQVADLYAQLNELRSKQDVAGMASTESLFSNEPRQSMSMAVSSRILPPLISPKRHPQRVLPQFHGPTSSTYGFDVAKSSLQTMGITQAILNDGSDSRDRSRAPSPLPLQGPFVAKDPLWSIDHSEALRLCAVYEEEIGSLYPIVEAEKILKHVNLLYSFITVAVRHGFGQPGLPGPDALDDEDTTILKMILAITLIVEGNGSSELGQRLFDSAKSSIDLKIVGPLDLKAAVMIVLTATYYFQKGEEAQAWRFIGIGARLCIEMGLHRRESLLRSFQNEAEYHYAIRIFWIVYALDRRWSFGTGMPFAIQDTDIDPSLPGPDDSHPYLKHITKYNRIATKIWQYTSAFESGENTKRDEVGFLDYQILQWYSDLPEHFQTKGKDLFWDHDPVSRGLRRMRLVLHLRKNQARISIYRPILHSATSIMENRLYAQNAVDVAKDTITTLTTVNQSTDIYQTQQVLYNYFLVQALAVIFLAVAHAPAIFAHQTRQEFYAAIDLVKGFSTKSHISRRLWRTIRGLKDMGEKIGMLIRGHGPPGTQDQADPDPHSDAAVTMAGMAGHKVDQHHFSTPYAASGQRESAIVGDLSVSPEDAQQMTNELSHLFEMAGGANGGILGSGDVPSASYPGFSISSNGNGNNTDLNPPDGFGFFGNEPEFAKILSELF